MLEKNVLDTEILGGEAGELGGEASPPPPSVDETLEVGRGYVAAVRTDVIMLEIDLDKWLT